MDAFDGQRVRFRNGLAIALTLPSFLLAAPTQVSVSGRKLLVNGQAFTVQAVAYSPYPVGATANVNSLNCVGPYYWWSDNPTYIADFPLIKKMGANAIRTYAILNDTTPSTVLQVRAALDAAQAQGLYVIMNYYSAHNVDPSDPAQQAAWLSGFVAAINAYKDHPAVLIWEFANENNLDNGQYIGWYPFVDQVAAAAKAADPGHPVMTVEGETTAIAFSIGNPARAADDAHMTHLDLWGANVYRGMTFEGFFQTVASSTSKPVLITEFGKDAYHDSIGAEDQTMQASYLTSQWNEISANLSATGSGSGDLAGGAVFEWTDSWWQDTDDDCQTHGHQVSFTRPDDPVDPNYQNEWFGVAAISPIDAITNPDGTGRSLRKIYGVMQNFWNPEAAPAGGGAASFFNGTVRNYPNPFQLGPGSTKFVVLTNEAGSVDIRIYDAGGQFVTSFSQDVAGPGRSEISWDGHNGQGSLVSSGLYIAKIHGHSAAHDETQYRRVVGVK